MNIPLFPPSASIQADKFDSLFAVLMVFSGAVVLLVGTVLVVFAIRFRAGSNVTRHNVSKVAHRDFEIGWISATVFAALGLFWWAAASALQQFEAPPDAMQIHVEAKQWMWQVRQPNGVRELNALHVPVDQPVVLYMNSQDVIHSFFVPAFRLKQDVVPGRTSTMWFHPTRTGTYRLFCAEYCGTDHSAMLGEVVVMTPADYAAWLDRQPAADTLAAEGKLLFAEAGCAGCHDARSPVHAPDLNGIFGRAVALSDGRTVVADDAYLRDSILLPARDVVAGYKPIMPDFSTILDAGQVEALVAWLHGTDTDREKGATP
jgi:cytochrome c oxidase subunit 2